MADGLTVTQAEIKAVLEMESKLKELRATITAKLFEGAQVEPGECWAMVDIGVSKLGVTKKLLVSTLGKEQAETIWGLREDSPYRRVKMGEGERKKDKEEKE